MRIRFALTVGLLILHAGAAFAQAGTGSTITGSGTSPATVKVKNIFGSQAAQSAESRQGNGAADDAGGESFDLTFEDFTDVEAGAWYEPYVRAMVDRGIVSGYRDLQGAPLFQFGPGDPVTVGQFLKMVIGAAAIDLSTCGDSSTQDPAASWVTPYVACAKQMRLRLFQYRVTLDRPIARGEAVGLLHDVFETPAPPFPSAFADTVNHRYEDDIAYAAARHIVSGTTSSDGTPSGFFLPNGTLNRSEASKILFLAVQTSGGTPATSHYPVTIDIEARNYAFSPSTVTVQKGQSVTLGLRTTQPHSFHLSAFNVHVPLFTTEKTVTFVASNTGTFPFSCTLAGHSEAGMTGKLIVK